MRLSKKQVNNHNNYVDRKIKNNAGNPAKPDYKYVPYKPNNVYRKKIVNSPEISEKPKHSMDFDMSFLFDNDFLIFGVLIFIGMVILYVFYAHISLLDVWNFLKELFSNPKPR